MAQVDPFIVPVPRKLSSDVELAPYFTYLNKFLHDLWVRTGAGVDLVADSAQLGETQTFTGLNTFTANIDLSSAVLLVDGVQIVGPQQLAVTNAAAATALNPPGVTGYTPHSSGGTTVTSNAATDLDTTAAALDTLVTDVGFIETAVSANIVDVADIRTQLNDLLAKLRTHGIIAT